MHVDKDTFLEGRRAPPNRVFKQGVENVFGTCKLCGSGMKNEGWFPPKTTCANHDCISHVATEFEQKYVRKHL